MAAATTATPTSINASSSLLVVPRHVRRNLLDSVARILIVVGLSLVVDLTAAGLMWSFESGLTGSEIHGFGDALFFTTVQILTVSSSLKNPVTRSGRVVDVALELWAIFVVTAVSGSFAPLFTSSDQT